MEERSVVVVLDVDRLAVFKIVMEFGHFLVLSDIVS